MLYHEGPGKASVHLFRSFRKRCPVTSLMNMHMHSDTPMPERNDQLFLCTLLMIILAELDEKQPIQNRKQQQTTKNKWTGTPPHPHHIHRKTNKQENQYNHNGHNNQKPNQRTTTPRNSTRHVLGPNIITIVQQIKIKLGTWYESQQKL